MNKIIFLFLTVFILSSCSTNSGVVIGETSSNTTNSISSKYKLSNRTSTKEFMVKEGETAAAKVNISTIKGQINLDIVDSDGESIYSGNQNKAGDFDFTVNATKPGKYTLKVVTKDHEGGYSVDWVVN